MASPAKLQSLDVLMSDVSLLQDERESPARDDTCGSVRVCPASSKTGPRPLAWKCEHPPMPEIQVDWYSREEADRLRDLRDRHGMVWRGVLLEGAKHAESIDLLKALAELHPALAHSRPGDHAGVSDERTNVIEQLHEQIRERQNARSTAELPPSAFTDTDMAANAKGSSVVESEGDRDDEDGEHFDVSAAVAQIQENRNPSTNHVQRSVADERTREREYQRWDAQAAQAVGGGETLHPADAHEGVEDVLRHPGDRDEWDVVDPRYDYEGYADE